MYKDFFKLSEMPFSIVPSSRYIFLSDRHREAMYYLQTGLGNGGGFGLMTGEVGTGKTTLSKVLLAQLGDDIRAGLLLNPTYSPTDLLEAICDEFSIIYPNQATMKQLTQAIYEYLLNNHANGLFTLLVIDEAQHLSVEVLEQLRLLTNLETDTQKLLKVLLIGQPELQHNLQQPNLRQLAQRITARYHLLPLTEDEVKSYIAFRLNMAGNENNVFSPKAMDIIASRTQGIPRLVNLVCDKALFYSYQIKETQISPASAKKACDDALYFMSPQNSSMAPDNSTFPVSKKEEIAHNENELNASNNQIAANNQVTQTASNEAISSAPSVNVNTSANTSTNTKPSLALKWPWSWPTMQHMLYAGALMSGLLIALLVWGVYGVFNSADAPIVQTNQTTDNTLQLIEPLIRRSNNPIKAMNDLVSLWGYKAKPSEGDCDQLALVQLQCYQGRETQVKGYQGQSGFMDLRVINRPAVLTLREQYRTYFAVLYKLSDKYAHLLLAGEQIRVPRSWLETHWGGEYQLLWHTPIKNMDLKLYDKDTEVQVLDSLLSTVLGESGVSSNVYGEKKEFDTGIQRKIEAFQTWQGIEVDGLLNEATLMRLDSLSNSDAPTLIYADSNENGGAI